MGPGEIGRPKELHADVERLTAEEHEGKVVTSDRKEALLLDWQRALWAVFTLLCIKGEIDLVEKLQLSAFERRLALLDGYFERLMGAPLPTGDLLPPRG